MWSRIRRLCCRGRLIGIGCRFEGPPVTGAISSVVPEVAEFGAADEERVEGALVDDAAGGEDDDVSGAAQCGAAVGDGEDGRTVERGEAVPESLLGLDVECGGEVVDDEQR